MKAYLIDPFAKSITEVEHDDSLQDIYKHIDANCMDAVRMANGDAIYVDDNGLFKEPQQFFRVVGYPNPIAGKGLVLGADHEGYSVDANCSLEELEEQIIFITSRTALQMAEWLDKLASANEADANKKGFSYIHISTADIMKEHEYTDPSKSE